MALSRAFSATAEAGAISWPQPDAAERCSPRSLVIADYRQRLTERSGQMSRTRISHVEGRRADRDARIPVRRHINGGLGHRNVSDYLNQHRIAEVRSALAAPSRADVPLLMSAIGARFGNLVMFNRVFKELFSITPARFGGGISKARRAVFRACVPVVFENDWSVSRIGVPGSVQIGRATAFTTGRDDADDFNCPDQAAKQAAD